MAIVHDDVMRKLLPSIQVFATNDLNPVADVGIAAPGITEPLETLFLPCGHIARLIQPIEILG
eukprot:3213715-Pyramimonas_sp.AAC.1